MKTRLKHWIQRLTFQKSLPRWQRFATAIKTVTPQRLTLTASDRCLILAPHPDDESIGCGALLLTYPGQCTVVCLTDGRLGIPGLGTDETVATRRREFNTAMAQVNMYKTELLGWPDGELSQQIVLPASIHLEAFTHIFLPNPLDQHPDHQAVSDIVANTLQQLPNFDGIQVAFYEIWGALAIPNAFLPVTHPEAKRALIAAYASQTSLHDYATAILGLHQYRGLLAEVPMAEAYTIMPASSFLTLISA